MFTKKKRIETVAPLNFIEHYNEVRMNISTELRLDITYVSVILCRDTGAVQTVIHQTIQTIAAIHSWYVCASLAN